MQMNYEDYRSMPESLSIEEMARLHGELTAEIGNDADAAESYEELVIAATKYAAFRSHWYLWSREERMEQDDRRTSCHDVVIIKFDQLARFLKKQGKSAAWREVLGYEERNPYCRKRIGDFACYIVFIHCLLAR